MLVNKIHHYTIDQKCSEWSLRCYTLLELIFWISGVLNDMFVSGLSGLASLPFHPQWSHSFQFVHTLVCQCHAFGQCCMFPKSLLVTFPVFPCCSLSSKIMQILQKLYFLNCYKFLIRALAPLLNGTLHHWYVVTALKITVYYNIVCFCLQTPDDG